MSETAPKSDKLIWLGKMLPGLAAETIETIKTRQSTREATSAKILGWTEASANAAKKPGDSLAHAVSAHGPGTDQTPRLVTGRRADEVVAEAATAPTDKVTLKAVPDGTNVEMPAWDKVGNDPSNVSSRFGSATQMLLVVEEAFAQAALLQSRIAAENKETDKQAMQDKDVQAAANGLGEARKLEAATRLAAKNASEALQAAIAVPTTPPDQVDALRKALETKAAAYTDANKAIETAIDTLRKAKQKAVPALTRSTIGEGREKLVVEPGGTIGESFKVGEGEAALETGADLSPEDMKRRYDSITNTKGIKTATIIMDPAYVEDEFGGKHKAGSQIQTAFPSTGEAPQREITPDDYKKTRAREDGTATLTPAKQALATAEQDKTKATKDREDQKAVIAALREQKDTLEARIEDLDPRNDPDKLAELYRTDPDIKNAEALDKAHKAAKLELAAAKAKIKDAETVEAALAEEEKRAIKSAADKSAELARQTKAMEASLASMGAALDGKSYEAAATAASDAAATLGEIRKQKAAAEKALAEADPSLSKDALAALKRAVSAATSLEQSSIRQITEARQTVLKGLDEAVTAAEAAKNSADDKKDKADEALLRATNAIVPAGPEPKAENFTTGPARQQAAELQRATKAWTGAVDREKKAGETKAAKAQLVEDAKAGQLAANDALADAKAKAELLRNTLKTKP